MSALGHKRTFAAQYAMSALPPKADISWRHSIVRFVPITTSSAICWKCTGTDQYRNSSVRLTRRYQADQDKQRYSALAPSLKLLAMIAQPMTLIGLVMTAQAPQSLPSSSSLSSLCSLFKYSVRGCSFECLVVHLVIHLARLGTKAASIKIT